MLSGWAVHAIALGCLCTCLQLIMQVVASDASATTRPDLTAVFTSGEKDERGFAINSFRIPGFVAANQALVGVAEARYDATLAPLVSRPSQRRSSCLILVVLLWCILAGCIAMRTCLRTTWS